MGQLDLTKIGLLVFVCGADVKLTDVNFDV